MIHRVPRLVLFLLAVLGLPSAHAQYQQWVYKNSVNTSLTFPTEEAAHANILASGGARAYLTKKAGLSSMGRDIVYQKYEAPPLDPMYTSDWVYQSAVVPGYYTSEGAMKAAIQAALETYQCPLELMEYDTSYGTSSWFGPLPIRQTLGFHFRYENPWYDPNLQQYVCLPNPNTPPNGAYIQRDRNAACPMYFTLSGNKCYNSTTATVSRKPLVCRPTLTEPTNPRGNPCDVTSGDKTLRETDYSAPGLEITREFHSKALSLNAGFGVNWSHNFNSYLMGSGGSSQSPVGAISASGYSDPVYTYVGFPRFH